MNDDKTGALGVRKVRISAQDCSVLTNSSEGTIPARADSQRLIHELQDRLIEFEIPKEEIRRASDERETMEALPGKYSDLYDFVPAAFFNLDPKGLIRAVNLTGAALMGAERSLLVNRHLDLFLSPETRSVFHSFLGRAFAGRSRETCEVVITIDSIAPILVQIEAVSSESREECHAVLIDITRHKLAEKAVELLNAELADRATELEGANRELEAFNITVAHDLRQPLNIIYGYCQTIELLSQSKLPKKELLKYVQGISNSTLRLNTLVGALVDFSHSSHVDLNRKNVDLSALAKTLATALHMENPERRVEFRIDDGIVAHGDEELLRIVLDNLLDNAWEATGKQAEATISFGTTTLDGKRAYFVHDQESSFDLADHARNFVPFRQPQGANGFRRLGVGLATVERIILRHGGSLWFAGEPGGGSTILFTLGSDRVAA
jgi:PAS domain S-box-containing protein